jgi:hypothetical protein
MQVLRTIFLALFFFFEGILLKCMKNTKLNTITILQYYGNNIKYFVFVKPTDLLVVTINEKNVLQVWDVSTGKFVKTFLILVQWLH